MNETHRRGNQRQSEVIRGHERNAPPTRSRAPSACRPARAGPHCSQSRTVPGRSPSRLRSPRPTQCEWRRGSSPASSGAIRRNQSQSTTQCEWRRGSSPASSGAIRRNQRQSACISESSRARDDLVLHLIRRQSVRAPELETISSCISLGGMHSGTLTHSRSQSGSSRAP